MEELVIRIDVPKELAEDFKKDDRAVDKDSLFLEALKKYNDLNLLNKNLYLQTIQALNNLTIAERQLGLPGLDKNAIVNI